MDFFATYIWAKQVVALDHRKTQKLGIMHSYWHLSTLLFCVITIGCGSDDTKTSATTSPVDERLKVKNEMPPPEYKITDVYADLRKQVLQLKPDAIGLNKADQSSVIAVLMESGFPEGVSTLVAVADGTSSLYYSTGGGVIGGGDHDSIRIECDEFVSLAQQYISKATLTKQFLLPQQDNVRFYFVTRGGVYTFEALEDDLGENRHACSPLFHQGHELITEILKLAPE